MLVYGRNPDLAEQEKSYIATKVDPAVSENTLEIKSTLGFSANQMIVVGAIGQENTELKYIGAEPDHETSTIVLKTTGGWSGFLYPHSVDAVVQVCPYDQIEFYKASSEGGAYSYLATVNLDVDQEFTAYDDLAGLPTDYYKVRFKNSFLGSVSEFSGETPASGYTSNSVSSLIAALRILVGQKPTDEELLVLLNMAQNAVFDLDIKWFFAKKKLTVPMTADMSTINLPNDFRLLGKCYQKSTTTVVDTNEVSHETTTTTTRTSLKLENVSYDYYSGSLYSGNTPGDSASNIVLDEAEKKLIIYPTTLLGSNTATVLTYDTDNVTVLRTVTTTVVSTLEINYWSIPTDLAQYTDETVVPNSRALVFWAASQLESAKKNETQSNKHWKEYMAAINSMNGRRVGDNQDFNVDMG